MRSLAYFIGTFAVALLLGIGSAWYMIEQGSPLTTTKVGPWASWNALGNPTADPYTKAHPPKRRLPLSSTVARYFVARTDGSGHGLTSGCEYLVTGSPINARWWSIALYDDTGSLIENASNRYSFNNEEALRHSDGTFRIRVAPTARPEKWLPSGDDTDRNPMRCCASMRRAIPTCSASASFPPTACPRSSASYASKDPRTLYRARNCFSPG